MSSVSVILSILLKQYSVLSWNFHTFTSVYKNRIDCICTTYCVKIQIKFINVSLNNDTVSNSSTRLRFLIGKFNIQRLHLDGDFAFNCTSDCFIPHH